MEGKNFFSMQWAISDNSHIKVEDNLITDKFYIFGQFFNLFKFRHFEIVWSVWRKPT